MLSTTVSGTESKQKELCTFLRISREDLSSAFDFRLGFLVTVFSLYSSRRKKGFGAATCCVPQCKYKYQEEVQALVGQTCKAVRTQIMSTKRVVKDLKSPTKLQSKIV